MIYNHTNHPCGVVIPRNEFSELFPSNLVNSGDLWKAEVNMPNGRWFIKVPDFNMDGTYWIWCANHLKGYLRCYWAGSEFQWWGFTEYDDIFYWLMKWV